MVIGNGMLAKMFSSYEMNKDIIIFASGVSNSNEDNPEEYKRELELIQTIEIKENITIVYFSSCDTIYSKEINKRYYFHKLQMEDYIKNNFSNYHIFRIPQVIGQSKNKNSLINLFIYNITNEIEFQVWENAFKNLIGLQEIYQIVSYVVNNKKKLNEILNIINTNYYSILEIVNTIELLTQKKAHIIKVKNGFKPFYEYEKISNIYSEINMKFDSDYLLKSIKLNYNF
jgi:UDP-2-acetamido-2,6-beta-L-arabino-hexul-4-ose reductase